MIKLPEPIWFQYRWTNPNDDRVTESMLAWKDVEPNWNQTVSDKCDELRAYSYGGKQSYEVRALHTEAQLKQAVRDFGEQCALLCGWAKANGEMRTAGECEAAIRALIEEIEA